jgi:hypothetical protein
MGLLDRVKRGDRGVPGRALVIVNRSSGREPASSSLRSQLRARLRPLPDGSGPESDVSQILPSHQVHLITAGMEIPALLGPETHKPVGVTQEGLDEAIGRYYLGLEPEHRSWEAALAAKRDALRKTEGPLGDVRYGIDELKDAVAAATALPGGLRDTFRQWKTALKELGYDHPRRRARGRRQLRGLGRGEGRPDPRRDTGGNEGSYAEERGVPAGRGDAVNSTWEQRVKWNQTARALYQKAMAEGTRRS